MMHLVCTQCVMMMMRMMSQGGMAGMTGGHPAQGMPEGGKRPGMTNGMPMAGMMMCPRGAARPQRRWNTHAVWEVSLPVGRRQA